MINMTPEEHAAICAALIGGALHERSNVLSTLISHNCEHASLANAYERELQALLHAGAAILGGKSA